ncbi:protein phosphatase CheZ [Alkalilimnicola sp. S0819]|uniref:protein phosphatase CheZ n=1 Tax=Alkalilimnicola sp. S0819 TaxID=2613922 RepID=UPI001261F2EB|nr:protein phosphatase CheZ [Alkalilimnicola sp. S0819]KAB7627163.1 protein phosphatase CheZ [Alkalilimnicola sp. S0819]MPQ15872.1 protein phosphatase CheZ [Alkalilimnicola sp. S0819]
MADKKPLEVFPNREYLELARGLIAALEAGEMKDAEGIVDELTQLRETELYKELGMLTRELHESIKSFREDTRLSSMVSSEIPDARDRLNHVITMTDQAAHRTLTAIEESMPLVDEISGKSRELNEQWSRFRRRELSVDEFRELSRELEEYLGFVDAKSGALNSSLTEALMAQDYQDLTGQIIRRVINLVQEMESKLVQLVALAGKPERAGASEKPKAADTQEDRIKAEGPAIPGKDDVGVVQGQDEVDDLLSSLGF